MMMGNELIRRGYLELDRRLGLHGGIFYLYRDELSIQSKPAELNRIISGRRKRWKQMLQIELPQVIFSDDLEAIGRPLQFDSSEVLNGTAVSPGIVSGEVKVVEDPELIDPAEHGYILVCQSTDPSWAPLLVHCNGLVLEKGGMLSHGAIIAREYGIPAVANIPGATRIFKTGEKIRIDGQTGKVFRLAE
jgi:phosphoenolpyruvate synthase/pyruvate phosphate dikinase